MTQETRETLMRALPHTSPKITEKIAAILLEGNLSTIQWSEFFNADVDVYCITFVNATVTQDKDMAAACLKMLNYSIACRNMRHDPENP